LIPQWAHRFTCGKTWKQEYLSLLLDWPSDYGRCCKEKSLYYTMFLMCGVCGGIVGWGAMLQAGRLQDWISMRSLDFFFNLSNPSSHTLALGSTQPLTEMCTRNILGGKGQAVLWADNPTTVYEPIV
jgi:hypothetical protein